MLHVRKTNPLRVYKHSGDLGDIVYSLPVIKHQGGGSLCISGEIGALAAKLKQLGIHFETQKEDNSPAGINAMKYAFIEPLLLAQDYIQHVQHINKEMAQTCDLDNFRRHDGHDTIYSKYRRAFNTPMNFYDEPWLRVMPKRVAKYVIARSQRYNNPKFPWKQIVKKYGPESVFVGLSEEYNRFCQMFGSVDFYDAKNALDMAQIMAGSQCVFCNQSLPYAIAEGLKMQTVQETSVRRPDCLFARKNATYFLNGLFTKLEYQNELMVH